MKSIPSGTSTIDVQPIFSVDITITVHGNLICYDICKIFKKTTKTPPNFERITHFRVCPFRKIKFFRSKNNSAQCTSPVENIFLRLRYFTHLREIFIKNT